jgi:rhomboid protease GluP
MSEWQNGRPSGTSQGQVPGSGPGLSGSEPRFAGSTHSYGTGYAEVLPPVPPTSASEPPKRRGRGWANAPATYTLVGINCAVYLAMVFSGVSPTSPGPEQLVRWGAAYGPFIISGEWWRLVTAMFVHIGFLHLATNMWCLWNLGLLGEPLLGTVGLIGVYLLTGFAGNLLSLVLHPGIADHGANAIIGAGASGAIFGIAGALILLLNSKYLPLAPADRKSLRKSVIWFAVLNFVLGAGVNLSHFSLKIDNSAHFGGFVEGLLVAIPLVPRIGAPSGLFRRRRNLALAAHVLLLLLLCAGVRTYERAAVQAEYGVTIR